MKKGPSENFSSPITKGPEKAPNVSESQQALQKAATEILQKNPDIQKNIANNFSKNLDTIVHNEKMLDTLLQNLRTAMKAALSDINQSFLHDQISSEDARQKSENIIKTYTNLQTQSLLKSLQ